MSRINNNTRRFNPTCEQLETRLVQSSSASVSTVLGIQVLTIQGDNKANVIQVFDQGKDDKNAIKVIFDGVTKKFDGNIQEIVIKSFGGNDKVTYTLEDKLRVDRNVFADLGDGNDIFKAIYNADIEAVNHVVAANGGKGNDALSIDAIGKVDKDDANKGGIDIAAGANVKWNLFDQVFAGDDSAIILYNGEMDGDLSFKMDLKNGHDFFRLQAELDKGSTGNLHANLDGGAGKDFFDVIIRKNNDNDPVDVFVNVDGGLGIDSGNFDVDGTLVTHHL